MWILWILWIGNFVFFDLLTWNIFWMDLNGTSQLINWDLNGSRQNPTICWVIPWVSQCFTYSSGSGLVVGHRRHTLRWTCYACCAFKGMRLWTAFICDVIYWLCPYVSSLHICSYVRLLFAFSKLLVLSAFCMDVDTWQKGGHMFYPPSYSV